MDPRNSTKSIPPTSLNTDSVQGGFLPEMTRREAALILGLRESAVEEKIKEAHRRIIIANHPDAGLRKSITPLRLMSLF